MAISKVQPNAPVPRPQHAWEGEETLVQSRNRWYRRIWHELTWFRLGLLVVVSVLLMSADLMNWFLNSALPYLVQLFSVIAFAIGQFAMIFWFLGRARTYTIWPGTTSEGISFKDYQGQPELIEQAKQIVTLLRGVRAFENAGGEPLNGLLLEGPPGTGKTWLAKAISTEAGVPFFYIDASSLMSMFMGIAPLKVMNLYRKARSAARDYGAAIIFIDEIDAVGARGGVATARNRGAEVDGDLRADRLPIFMGMGGSGLLSTLLVEMDGFSLEHGRWARWKRIFYKQVLRRSPPKPERRVLTIGATNRIQALDAALLRPGRFDKKVRVDAPDLEGRQEIFDYYLSKVAHDDDIDTLILASETPGYTPADIKHLLNEALRHALFDGRYAVNMSDIRVAQPEHEYGLKTRHKNMTAEAKRRLAAHESGHAMAIRIFMTDHRIARITIIGQGAANGYVSHYPASEASDFLGTFESLTNRLRVSVAGRAAELEFMGDEWQSLGVGTGFGDGSDFGRSRGILLQMASAGMFGPLGADLSGMNVSKDLAELMENTFQSILEEVRLALRMNLEMGEALIALLIEKEELFAPEIESFFARYGFITPKVDLDPYRLKAGDAA